MFFELHHFATKCAILMIYLDCLIDTCVFWMLNFTYNLVYNLIRFQLQVFFRLLTSYIKKNCFVKNKTLLKSFFLIFNWIRSKLCNLCLFYVFTWTFPFYLVLYKEYEMHMWQHYLTLHLISVDLLLAIYYPSGMSLKYQR